MTSTRVVHVGKFYPPAPGGMERVVQLLCEGTHDGIESRVVAANTGWRTTTEMWRGVHVTRVGCVARIGSVGVCPTFPLELSRIHCDVTVIHEPNPLGLASDWLTAEAGPLIVWFHSEVFHRRWKYRLLYRPLLRRVLERSAAIVVSSPRLAEHASELHDFRHKCRVIPFGIDTERLKLTTDLAGKVSKIRDAFPGPRVMFVGRLVPYKGVDVLVRAMPMVQGSAVVIGDGPERERLRSAAMASPAARRIHFLGQLPDEDVAAHLHACDLFVLPSVTDAETFGVAQLEAMACGKPVVSTDLATGVPWVNRHGETGFVVPPGDEVSLADALRRLGTDGALRRRMGEAARRRVENDFTVEKMTATAAALYREVAASPVN